MSDSFCVLPWLHLATHPHGGTTLCCQIDHSHDNGISIDYDENNNPTYLNINRNSVKHLMNSDTFKQVRLDMLSGKKPKGCSDCWNKESNGVESKRQYENKNYSNFTIKEAISKTSLDGTIDPDFRFIELRLGNTCNLVCRTCNPASSSKWVREYKKLQNDLDFVFDYNIDKNEYKWPKSMSFWDDLSQYIQNLETIYINGGEPFLNTEHLSFLKFLIDNNISKNIYIYYNTNGTIVNETLLDYWTEFRKVNVQVSVDDIEDRNYYIRHGANWDSIVTFIDSLDGHNIDWAFTQTVSAYNFIYLDDLAKFAKERNRIIGYNYVHTPNFLSPLALPIYIRQKAIDNFKYIALHEYENIKNLFYKISTNVDLFNKFQVYTKYLDNSRNQSINQFLPELWQEIRTYNEN